MGGAASLVPPGPEQGHGQRDAATPTPNQASGGEHESGASGVAGRTTQPQPLHGQLRRSRTLDEADRMSEEELRRRCAERGVVPSADVTRAELQKLWRELAAFQQGEVSELRVACRRVGLHFSRRAGADELRALLQRRPPENTMEELTALCRERGVPPPPSLSGEPTRAQLLELLRLAPDSSSDDDAADPNRRASQQRRRRRRSSLGTTSGDDDAENGAMSTWRMLRQLPAALAQGYEELVQAIIRPPRAQYDARALGKDTFRLGPVVFERSDFDVRNDRGQRLVCSWWGPRGFRSPGAHPLPVMIYLHGNSSCRCECLEALPALLSSGVTLLAFDFAGSGQSDGEYVSLGYYEREDLASVIQFVRSSGLVSTVGLWGRSMGAVTALLYADRDPSVACMVVDSPFCSLRVLAQELVESAQVRVPGFAVGLAMRAIRSSCRTRAKFDIFKLEPIENVGRSFVPALFAAAEGDTFIRPHHAQRLHDQYVGDKNLVTFAGNHNSPRPSFFLDSAMIFVSNTMIEPALRASMGTRSAVASTAVADVVGAEFHMPAPMIASSHVLRPAGDDAAASSSVGHRAPSAGPQPGPDIDDDDHGAVTILDGADDADDAALRLALALSLQEQ